LLKLPASGTRVFLDRLRFGVDLLRGCAAFLDAVLPFFALDFALEDFVELRALFVLRLFAARCLVSATKRFVAAICLGVRRAFFFLAIAHLMMRNGCVARQHL
jgi:hypothetical protein